MPIVRWDPFREISGLQGRMNRLFNEATRGQGEAEEDYVGSRWMPAVDVRERKESLEIQAELPGIDPKDVNVSVENRVLTIRGSREFEKASEGEAYHRVERAYGTFERSFTLPTNVDPEKINATYRHGVLHLNLPKREEAKPRSIQVKIND